MANKLSAQFPAGGSATGNLETAKLGKRKAESRRRTADQMSDGGGQKTAAPADEMLTKQEPVCLTRKEVAEHLRISVRTVDRMIASGQLPVRRVRGRAVRFLRSDVERYLHGDTNRTGRLPETNLLKSTPNQ